MMILNCRGDRIVRQHITATRDHKLREYVQDLRRLATLCRSQAARFVLSGNMLAINALEHTADRAEHDAGKVERWIGLANQIRR